MIDAGSRVGRDGTLALRFERRAARTVLAGCRYTLPLQVLAPVALADRAAVVSILNPTGGLLGGDCLTIDVEAAAGVHACLTTPSATRVYRTAADPALQTVRLRLAAGATVEWVPDHTIPYAGAAFRQSIEAEVDEGAALVLVDAFAAGRVARGEAWRFARLESAITVRDARGWLLCDRFVLDGDRVAAGLGVTEGYPYFATVVVVADDGIDRFAAALACALPGGDATRAAVAALPRRGALVRCLAAGAPDLLDLLDLIWRIARRELLGLPPLALRKP